MNESIRNQRPANCKVFTEIKFIVGFGMIIGAADFSQQGKVLFFNTDKEEEADDADMHLSYMGSLSKFSMIYVIPQVQGLQTISSKYLVGQREERKW
jgi:hypothetical protein